MPKLVGVGADYIFGQPKESDLGFLRSSQSSGSILRWWMRWTRSSSMRCDTACFTALHKLEASGRAVVRRGHPSSSRALLRTHRRSTRPSIGFPIKLLSTVGVRSPPSSETPCGSTSASALHLFSIARQVASEVSKALRKEAGKGCTMWMLVGLFSTLQVHYTVDEKQRQCVLIEAAVNFSVRN